MKIRNCILFISTAGACMPALAYVGPGAGLTLLGALWGLLAAIAAALMFVIVWPLRQWRKRVRAQRTAGETPSAAHPEAGRESGHDSPRVYSERQRTG